MKVPRIPVPFIVFLGLLVWSATQTGVSATAQNIGEGVKNFDDLAERFETLAEEQGGVYAFTVLREAKLPPNIDLHLLGHKIGDVMYKQEGIDGIALCTDEFRNACSHTMVIGALTEFGESALPQIREACKRAPGGPGAYTMCYHGLGHGVFAFYEYSMPETVAMCKKTGTEEYREREAIECVGGAVMELSGGGGHDRETWLLARAKYIESDPVGFCLGDEVPANTKSQCLTYITPELWKRVGIDMGNPNPVQYKDAFALCDRIPRTQPELRHTCYSGFGKEFVPLAANRDIRAVESLSAEKMRDVVTWCGYAGSYEGTSACVEQAVYSLFWGGENDPQASFRFCSVIEDAKVAEHCYRTIAQNIHHYVHTPQRGELCSALPSYAQDMCE